MKHRLPIFVREAGQPMPEAGRRPDPSKAMQPDALTSTPQTLLAGLLQALKALYPPERVVHVGAGRGQGELHTWRQWDVPGALLIDADEKRLDWATATTLPTHWQAITATLSDHAAAVDYHLASNPDEDGLLAPKHLTPLWPNLRTTKVETRHTRTLDKVLQQARLPAPAHPAAWLIIDCLPALPILQGSQAALAQTQVVCVRAAQPGEGPDLHNLRHDAVTAHLAPLGFVAVAQVQGNHPALSHVVYARDLGSQLAQLQQQTQTLIASNDHLEQASAKAATAHAAEVKARAAAIAQRDAEAKAKEAALSQLSQETNAKARALAQVEALHSEKAQLTADIAALTKAHADAAAARDAEAQAKAEAVAQRDAEANAKAQAHAQRDALNNEKAKLTADIAELTKAHADAAAARDAEAKAKEEAIAQRNAEANAKAEALAQRDSLNNEKAQLTADIAALAKAHADAAAARDAEAKAKTEALAQRDAEANAKAQALAQRDALHNEKAQLTADIATLTKAHADAEAKTRAEAIAQRDAEAKAKSEALAQRDAEAKAKAEALAQRDAEAREKTNLITLRDEQTALATTHQRSLLALQQDAAALQQRNQQLETINQENATRQQMLQEELIKAEAQIELIKDLLLREQGL